jgi:hypothetical protein
VTAETTRRPAVALMALVRSDLEIPIAAPDVDSAIALLREHATGLVLVAGLRVDPHGRVRARISGTVHSDTPTLAGRLTAGPGRGRPVGNDPRGTR